MELQTLEDFLSNEISKGPHAKKGKIDYLYQSFENVYNFFTILLLDNPKFKLLCVPQFNVKFSNYIVRAAIAIETKKEQYWIADKTYSAIHKCMKNPEVRFIYISLVISYEVNDTLAHANIIIIDLHEKTIERFEPYGWSLPHHEFVDYFMKNICRSKLGLHNFKYMSPQRISEKIGVQTRADSYNGMCITISMLYLHLRLLNPNIGSKKIVKYLLSISDDKLKILILKYAKYIEEKLNQNYKLVNSLNNELYI